MKPQTATAKTKSESLWTKTPVANLVRYEPSGIYFVRAKVRGKLIRKSLETNVLSVAKQRLADVLDAEHKALAPKNAKIVGKMTFSQALAIVNERQKQSTEIKQRTKEYPMAASKLGSRSLPKCDAQKPPILRSSSITSAAEADLSFSLLIKLGVSPRPV